MFGSSSSGMNLRNRASVMQKRKSSNTHIHVLRGGYSPKADGPKIPPRGGSAVQHPAASPAANLRATTPYKSK